MAMILIHCFMCHLFGDYIIQNDWMALNKKVKTFHCFVHVSLYSVPFFLIPGLSFVSIFLIFLQHFIQDRTNIILWFMNKTGKDKFAKPPCGPWSIIVTDNVVHLIWIYFVVLALNAKFLEMFPSLVNNTLL